MATPERINTLAGDIIPDLQFRTDEMLMSAPRYDMTALKYMATDLGATPATLGSAVDSPVLAPLGAAKVRTALSTAYEVETPKTTNNRTILDKHFYHQVGINVVSASLNTDMARNQIAGSIIDMIEQVNVKIAENLAEQFVKAPQFFGSPSVELSPRKFHLLKRIFSLNKFSAAQAILFANSTTESSLLGVLNAEVMRDEISTRNGRLDAYNSILTLPAQFLDGFSTTSTPVGSGAVLAADVAAGATTISVDVSAVTGNTEAKAGDTITIADHKKNLMTVPYTIAADASPVADVLTLTLNQPIVSAIVADSQAVTWEIPAGTHGVNIAMVPKSFSLVTRPIISSSELIPGSEHGLSYDYQDFASGVTYNVKIWADNSTDLLQIRVGVLGGMECLQTYGAVRVFSQML